MEEASCAAVSPDGGPTTTCDASAGGVSLQDLVATAAAAFSALGMTAILLMQMDVVSRRMLSPPRLLAKRRKEYQYAVSQSCEYNALMMRQHVGGGRGNYDPKSEPSSWETLTDGDVAEMDEVVSDILDDAKRTPVIVALEQDPTDDRYPDTYYLFLAFPPPHSTKAEGGRGGLVPPPGIYRRVRVPLLAFCELLSLAFEGQMTSTTLCFVADASSGLGSETLAMVARRCNYGVAVISNPAWMTSLSLLISKKKLYNISDGQYERVAFALCRLEAWRVRDSVGASRTVLITLPGQSCVPLLLPLVQRVFTHDRHVFVYDGCCPSAELGAARRRRCGSSYRQNAAEETWEGVSASPDVVTSNFPMAPLRHVRGLPDALARLDGTRASVVESWMASVDTLLDMKSNERRNFYAPFVCRAGFLMGRSAFGNGSRVGDAGGLALKNVLEYITGSKSRAIPDAVMRDAASCLGEMRAKFEDDARGCALGDDERDFVERCVFAHKSILLGDKTLLDTVQPLENWSLKAAKKLKSCLCCIPGEGDEEDDDNDDGDSLKPMDGVNSAAGVLSATIGKSKYVDGKSQFAFDPTLFST